MRLSLADGVLYLNLFINNNETAVTYDAYFKQACEIVVQKISDNIYNLGKRLKQNVSCLILFKAKASFAEDVVKDVDKQ